MPEPSPVTINGSSLPWEGDFDTAVAITLTQTSILRRSVNGEPRGPLCGMGICFECRVAIDGEPHRLSCQTPCKPGMTICTDASSPASCGAPFSNTVGRFPIVVLGSG